MVENVSICLMSKRHGDCTLCESSFFWWNSEVLNTFEPCVLSRKPDLEGGLLVEEDASNQLRRHEQKWKGKKR